MAQSANRTELEICLNGTKTRLSGYSMARLLDVLREQGRMTGVKEGCGEGECGACSVLMNGRLVNSCLVPWRQAEGARIETIEGFTSDATTGALHPLQAAFLKKGGAQCGICTPGMILAAEALLRKNASPTREEIREGLAGNLCRCTGYMKIYDAVEAAACSKRESIQEVSRS